MSKVIRSVKNVTKGYSNIQVKVREATSNDPWGPTGTQMSEIAQRSFNGSTEFYEIVDMLDKRLNDKGKNWRHVLKALKVLDYCLHEGSESVVTWARQNIYIIKTLREFQYIDEEGRDVGQNVRVAAKELTTLIMDEERLRAERNDRRSWKSRVTGLEEYGPPPSDVPSSSHRRPRERRNPGDQEDTEYRLAIEASLNQEEEDRRRRESRADDGDDEELERAIKLSREEDEARKQRDLDNANAVSLFDDAPSAQPQPTGANQGYQQGSAVDFFANPIEQGQVQPQQTAYMTNMYTGFPQNQPTGFQNGFQTGYQNGFSMQQQQTPAFDSFSQQQQQQQTLPLVQQPTSFNPYAQQQQQQQEAPVQSGSNNPWATSNTGLSAAQSLQPTPTGSNNPFASNPSFSRPQAQKVSSLSSLPEQQPLASFNQPAISFSQPSSSFSPPSPQQQPQRELSEHEAKLNALLSSGDGMDTFGNTGNLRIPAQHTAPGTFVNSAGANLNRLNSDATGSNPFMRQQFTGLPQVSFNQIPATTGPAGMNGAHSSNPFAQRQQQSGQNADLIQL